VTFDLDARLPDQVFRARAGDWLFCEFGVVLAPDLWPALCMMARWHGDERIELLVLEPDCDDFYLPKGLGYPARSLSVEAGEDDYWAAIGFEPERGGVRRVGLLSLDGCRRASGSGQLRRSAERQLQPFGRRTTIRFTC
jgi:hypothetical protein